MTRLGLKSWPFWPEGRCTELSRREVVAPRVVGGLLVSYLRLGAGEEVLVAAPPSEGGMREASMA